MKIISVAGCSVCPHGARWELDKPHFMCSKLMRVNEAGPKPPSWCPLQDALQFVKELVNQQPTAQASQLRKQIFDSTRCKQIGEELIAALENAEAQAEITPALCAGTGHGSCKGKTMCEPNNACFRPA